MKLHTHIFLYHKKKNCIFIYKSTRTQCVVFALREIDQFLRKKEFLFYSTLKNIYHINFIKIVIMSKKSYL